MPFRRNLRSRQIVGRGMQIVEDVSHVIDWSRFAIATWGCSLFGPLGDGAPLERKGNDLLGLAIIEYPEIFFLEVTDCMTLTIADNDTDGYEFHIHFESGNAVR